MRLLVVEDEVRIAEILRKSLGKAGFAVDSVASCGDAQAAREVGTYDAMILDLGLPDGDGLALLGRLRSGGAEWYGAKRPATHGSLGGEFRGIAHEIEQTYEERRGEESQGTQQKVADWL